VVGAGVYICLGWGADLYTAHLMPLTISSSSKPRLILPFWCRLTWVVPDKGPLNGCCCCCCCSCCCSLADRVEEVAQMSRANPASPVKLLLQFNDDLPSVFFVHVFWNDIWELIEQAFKYQMSFCCQTIGVRALKALVHRILCLSNWHPLHERLVWTWHPRWLGLELAATSTTQHSC